MEHYPAGSSLFPDEYASGFYFASSAEESAGVIRVPFDTALGSSTGVSAHLVKSRASFPQAVTGLAFGPDGLYFTSILPDSSGTSAVFRLSYDPAAGYDLGLYGGDAEGLIGKYGCRSCHQLDGSGGAVGPALDTNALNIRVRSRLNSPEYSQLVADLDARNEDPWAAWSDERRAILDAGGRAQLARWVSAKIQEPRFDDPDAQMPQLGVTKAHADTMAAYLVGTPRPQPWYSQAVETVFGSRRALLTFAVGAMGGLALGVVGHVWWSRRQRRQGPSRT
jgi:cytochrome c551/c552